MTEKIPNYQRNLKLLSDRSIEQLKTLEEIEREAFANFKGTLPEIESALGMLRMGHHVGWRVLVLVHSKATLRKYEKILGIKVREFFPEETPSSTRNNGFKIAKKLGNFWKAVSGDIKIDHKKNIE